MRIHSRNNTAKFHQIWNEGALGFFVAVTPTIRPKEPQQEEAEEQDK